MPHIDCGLGAFLARRAKNRAIRSNSPPPVGAGNSAPIPCAGAKAAPRLSPSLCPVVPGWRHSRLGVYAKASMPMDSLPGTNRSFTEKPLQCWSSIPENVFKGRVFGEKSLFHLLCITCEKDGSFFYFRIGVQTESEKCFPAAV
jgi:hypothetical protein